MDYKDYLEVYGSVAKRYRNSRTDNDWIELQTAEKRYLEAVYEAISREEVEASLSLSDFYESYQTLKNGQFAENLCKAETVLEDGDIWKKDIFAAVQYVVLCIKNKHYEKAIGVKELFPEEDGNGLGFFLKTAEEMAKIFQSPDSIIEEDLRILGKKCMNEYSENVESFNNDCVAFWLSQLIENDRAKAIFFTLDIDSEVGKMIEGGIAPQPEMLDFYTTLLSCTGLICGEDGVYVAAAHYLARTIKIESILTEGKSTTYLNKYSKLFRHSVLNAIFPLYKAYHEEKKSLSGVAKIMFGIDVSVNIWIAYIAFLDKEYGKCRDLLTETMNAGVCSDDQVLSAIIGICRFKQNEIDFNNFCNVVDVSFDKFAKDQNEDAAFDVLICLEEADMALISQRMVFWLVESMQTPRLTMLAADYYLDPCGDINRDEESAYAMYSEAAKLGSDEAKDKLKHFKRSLFGKLSYND